MAFKCLACEEQNYQGDDNQVSSRVQLCSFHEENGAYAKRSIEREVVDISTRRSSQSSSLEELGERVKKATSAVQKGLALHEMKEVGGLSVPALSQYFGKTDMWAYSYLNLTKLSEAVQRLVENEELKLGVAREIGRVVPVEYQMDIVREVQNMTIPEAKERIAKCLRQWDGARQGEMESEDVVPPPPLRTDVELAETASREERFPEAAVVFLRALGDADRSLSHLLDVPYSTLRNAFADPEDLKMAKRHVLTTAYRLNEVIELLEAMERSRM